MQLHAGNEVLLRIPLPHGVHRRTQFARRVGEVLVCHRTVGLANLLQTVACTREGANRAVEIVRSNAYLLTSEAGGLQVLHVVLAEHLHRHLAAIRLVGNRRNVWTGM